MPSLDSAQSLDHQVRAGRRQLRPQSLGCVFRTNRNFALQKYVARVEPRVNAHGCHPGDGFTAGDCPLNRRRTAILWQQRRMQVYISKPGKINHPLRNDAAIANNNDRVRANRNKLVAEFGIVLDGTGLQHGNAEAERRLFHGRNGHFHPPSARPIGLRHHQRNGMPGRDQFLQRRDSETRSAAENQKHKSQVSGLRTSQNEEGHRLKSDQQGSRNKCFSWHLPPATCHLHLTTLPPSPVS